LGPEEVEITLVKGQENLFLPAGSTHLRPPALVQVRRDPLGTLRIPRGTEPPVAYSVWFTGSPSSEAPPSSEDLDVPPRIAPTLRELAGEMAGAARGETARAAAIEGYLQANYGYSLRTYAPVREDPVIWFLQRGRQGHCEFFAAAMTLLLRAQGTPARLQVGFLGGTAEPDGGFVVRDSHAHAWVVGWVDGGWRVFDPTPPDGQPGLLAAGAAGSVGWSWEMIEAWWDRWVLTFSMADQVELVRSALEAIWAERLTLGAGLGVTLLAGAALALLRRLPRGGRPRPGRRAVATSPVGQALRRVMAATSSRGFPILSTTTPSGFKEVACAAFPPVAEAVTWLIGAHERCCYAGGEPPARGELRRREREILRGMAHSPKT
jgi:hypothetical protein